MEISRDIASKARPIQAVPSPDAGQAAQVKASKSGSQIEVSSSAREMQQLLQLAQEAEPIRPDKVEALKEKIESGTYRVNLEAIANGMLNDL